MSGRAPIRSGLGAAVTLPVAATLLHLMLVVVVVEMCGASSTSRTNVSRGEAARGDADLSSDGGAVYTDDRLALFGSVWGHDEAAKGIDHLADDVLDRLDLLQSLRNHTRSERCRRDLDVVLEARTQLKMWALKMDYSSVALPGAVLSATKSHMGDFDACVAAPGAMYCLLDAEIRPLSAVGAAPHELDEKSPFEFPNGDNATLWDVLRTSGNRRRYRRDSQQWAVCLPKGCGHGMSADRKGSSKDLGEALAGAVSPVARALGVQLRLHLEPGDCYPDPASTSSSSTALTQALNRPLFLLGSLFLLLFPALVMFEFVRESMFDHESEREGKDAGARQSIPRSILSCFSIRKNSRALTKRRGSFINAIQGMRVLGMVGVLAGHRALFPNMGPVLNPDLFENEFDKPAMMTIVNGNVIVTVFFVITAFLEARTWLTEYEQRPFSFARVLLSYIGRWLRLVPALAAMVAFDALWLEHLGAGPIWGQQVTRAAVQSCKDSWWTNLLFINNYYGHGCLLHTWFLAVVLQLSLVTPFVMWAVHRSSRPPGGSVWRGSALLLLLLAVASLTLYVCTAVNRLLPATPVFPMILHRFNLVFDGNFTKQYLPTHTNAISYIVGLLAGSVVFFVRTRAWSPSQFARRVLVLGIPFGAALMPASVSLGVVYLLYDSKRPWLEALWAPARTLAFSSPVAWFLVACSMGCGGVLEWFLSRTPMIVLGRLTYCVYLCHVSLVFATSGYVRQPLFVSRVSFFHAVAGDIVFSFFFGYVLHICVEAPMVNAMTMLMSSRLNKKNDENKGTLSGRDQTRDADLRGDSPSTLDASAVESQVSKL